MIKSNQPISIHPFSYPYSSFHRFPVEIQREFQETIFLGANFNQLPLFLRVEFHHDFTGRSARPKFQKVLENKKVCFDEKHGSDHDQVSQSGYRYCVHELKFDTVQKVFDKKMLRTRYPYRVIYSSRNTFRAYSQESVILKPEERADSEPVVCPESKDADPMMPLQYIPFRVDAESALKKAQDFLRGKLGMGYVYPRLLDTKESPLMKVYIPFYAFSVTARTYVSAQSRKTGQFVHHCIHHRYNSLEMKPMQILATLKIPRSYVYQFRGEAFKMMRPIYDDNDTLDHQTLKKEDLQDCEMLPFSIPPMLCLYKFIEPFIEGSIDS